MLFCSENCAEKANIFNNILFDEYPMLKTILMLFKRANRDTSQIDDLITEAYRAKELPKSVILFTTHKCASSFMDQFLEEIVRNSSYTVVNYAATIWKLGDRLDIGSPYEPFLNDNYDLLYKKRGFIYAPQRRALDFSGLSNFKSVFFLRDPRDVLVSAYHSFGFSHGPPKGKSEIEKFHNNRKQIRHVGIDQYALQAAEDWLLPLYNSYIKIKENSNDCMYQSYDDFKDDPERFIKAFCVFMDVSMSGSDVEKLTEASSVSKNRLKSKLRSGLSKQYLTALDSATVDVLNMKFAKVLKYWKFEI